MTTKLCYNKGCGQNYEESENKDESCRHHPGAPVFHDCYKIWSCCDKKSTSFSEFLDIKGCTVGRHNPVKPQEPPKPKPQDCDMPKIEKVREPTKTMERPSESQKMKRLPFTVAASLKPVLEKLNEQGDQQKEQSLDIGSIPSGTPCKNFGCKASYTGEHSNKETCRFHSGAPVFHEGMKYWSCCQRKSTDFEAFFEQEGCSTGRHLWFKKASVENTVACRYDWHQTGGYVVISVFAKGSFPDKSYVDLNAVKCRLYIVFGGDRAVFDKTFVLGGIVNVEASSVEYFGSKVEIKLKKAEAVSWKDLQMAVAPAKQVVETMENISLDDVEALVNHEANEDAKKRFFSNNPSDFQ